MFGAFENVTILLKKKTVQNSVRVKPVVRLTKKFKKKINNFLVNPSLLTNFNNVFPKPKHQQRFQVKSITVLRIDS